MKNFIRILCLAMCLCILPVFGLAEAPANMTAYQVSGIAYYIWNDWAAPTTDDVYVYYYKTADNPLDGFVMTMELVGETPQTEADMKTTLDNTVTGIAQALGSDVNSQELIIDGRPGCYFYGEMSGMFGLAGYVTFTDAAVVAIVVVDPAIDEATTRTKLMEVLNIREI